MCPSYIPTKILKNGKKHYWWPICCSPFVSRQNYMLILTSWLFWLLNLLNLFDFFDILAFLTSWLLTFDFLTSWILTSWLFWLLSLFHLFEFLTSWLLWLFDLLDLPFGLFSSFGFLTLTFLTFWPFSLLDILTSGLPTLRYQSYQSKYAISDQLNQSNSIKWSKNSISALLLHKLC